jgi:2-oxoglutarate ferredoxin oxidoreductase subunit delta
VVEQLSFTAGVFIRIMPQMAGKIVIDKERCKGCTLCVTVCPHNVITISDKANSKGYFPAEATGPNCTGCANCAVVCPDCAIEVYREDAAGNIKSVGPDKKKEINNLVREPK